MELLYTPMGQTILMGIIFLFVFAAYITIQGFASKLCKPQPPMPRSRRRAALTGFDPVYLPVRQTARTSAAT
eukprot:813008-Prymnesium_polylepis.1